MVTAPHHCHHRAPPTAGKGREGSGQGRQVDMGQADLKWGEEGNGSGLGAAGEGWNGSRPEVGGEGEGQGQGGNGSRARPEVWVGLDTGLCLCCPPPSFLMGNRLVLI